MLYQLVGDTMGEDKLYFTPYIGTLFLFTLCANLMGLFTFRSPTADLNTTAAFAIIFFGLVQVFSIKANGLKNRIKGFAEPVPVVLPLNIVGEFSTPIALALRLFGNHGFGHRGNFPAVSGSYLGIQPGIRLDHIFPGVRCGSPGGAVHLL